MSDVTTTGELRERALSALARVGVRTGTDGDGDLRARTPITGEDLFGVPAATAEEADAAIADAHEAFLTWRTMPAPRRGELVRLLGERIREHREALADLVADETGKIRSEALGEVQEMIDVCEFAVGLSRRLYGRTIASERPGHRLAETWHPLGVVGVISAFNFPAAVWAWNTAVALVCGDPVVWKPSELTPLTSLACDRLLRAPAEEAGAPDGVHRLLPGDRALGEHLVDDPRVALVSATGSVRMGRESAPASPPGSGAACWNWAATTPPWSPRRPTSTSPPRPWCSPPRAPPGSAAPPCAASSSTRASPAPSPNGSPPPTAACPSVTRCGSPRWSGP